VRDIQAEAHGLLESHDLTAMLAPRRIRQTANGEYQPYQIQLNMAGGQVELPLAVIMLGQRVGGWEDLFRGSSEQLKAVVPELVAAFLAQTAPDERPSERLAALVEVLERETAALRERITRQQAEYGKTSSDLSRQQQALGHQQDGGLIHSLFRAAVDTTRIVQMFNLRESQAFKLESGEAALAVLAAAVGQMRAAQANLDRVREFATAARQTLHGTLRARRQAVSDQAPHELPDWRMDHAQLAGLLAVREVVRGSALGLLFAPPETLAEWLADLERGAERDAQRLVMDLSLDDALDLVRGAEDVDPDLDLSVLAAQLILDEGCLSRGYLWADQPTGRGTVLQLVPAGQAALDLDNLEQSTLHSVTAGGPGRLGWMIITEDIAPADLAVVGEARAALAAAQPRQNGALLEALLTPEPTLSPTPPVQPSTPVTAPPNGQHEPVVEPLAPVTTPPNGQHEPGADLPTMPLS
jgi:hypothetical protein